WNGVDRESSANASNREGGPAFGRPPARENLGGTTGRVHRIGSTRGRPRMPAGTAERHSKAPGTERLMDDSVAPGSVQREGAGRQRVEGCEEVSRPAQVA